MSCQLLEGMSVHMTKRTANKSTSMYQYISSILTWWYSYIIFRYHGTSTDQKKIELSTFGAPKALRRQHKSFTNDCDRAMMANQLQGFPQLRYPKCKKNVFWFPSYFPTCILYIGLRRVVPIRGAKCSDHVIESFLHSSFTWGQRIWSEFFSCQHVCTAACSIFVNQKHLRIHPKEVTRLHGTYPNS